MTEVGEEAERSATPTGEARDEVARDPGTAVLWTGSERRHVLGCGAVAVAALAGLALLGLYQTGHGHHWFQRANGGFAFQHCGLAALSAAASLASYAFASSAWMAQLEWAFPVRGRWLRYLACGIIVLFAILALLLLIMQPIA